VTFVRGFLTILAGAWRASRSRTIATFALTLLSYASAPLTPLALKHVTDAVLGHDVGAATRWAVFLPLLALVNAIGQHLLHVLFVEVADQNVIDLTDDIAGIAHGPSGIAHLENSNYANELELISNEGTWRYMSVRSAVVSVGVLVQLTLTILLLARLQPILLLLLAFALPPLVATRWAWQRFNRMWRASADRMRRASHYADLVLRADAAKEVRLFGLEQEIGNRVRASRAELRLLFFRTEIAGIVAQAAGFAVFAVAYVLALLVVVRGAVRGAHTTGDVVLAVSLAGQTNQLVYGVVSAMQRLQRASTAADRMRSMRQVLAKLYPPRHQGSPAPGRIEQGVRVEGVVFRYPETGTDVLDHVDLQLPAGSTVAFVGENGAGKSTLVKLLCRYYDPSGGRITVDGVDLGTIDPDAWRERIAAGFQDFVRFELLASESVGIGDLSRISDIRAVDQAVDRGAARDVIEDLPGGLETPIGTSHPDGGTELSGGQWQKLALARAMMRERPLLLVLDEPTSALDAHAEHELFDRYAESARAVAAATGGIAIFVSHRFSTVRMADRIVVIEDGRIAEQGTHEELVRRDGIYAELFSLQAAAYG